MEKQSVGDINGILWRADLPSPTGCAFSLLSSHERLRKSGNKSETNSQAAHGAASGSPLRPRGAWPDC